MATGVRHREIHRMRKNLPYSPQCSPDCMTTAAPWLAPPPWTNPRPIHDQSCNGGRLINRLNFCSDHKNARLGNPDISEAVDRNAHRNVESRGAGRLSLILASCSSVIPLPNKAARAILTERQPAPRRPAGNRLLPAAAPRAYTHSGLHGQHPASRELYWRDRDERYSVSRRRPACR